MLELKSIGKSFPGVQALKDVSLEIYPGEVHMLLGENGAGKSTLMKVLCGAYRADKGQILERGRAIDLQSASAVRSFGVAVIFQEFSLVPYLSIAQNIFLGREPAGWFPGVVDTSRMRREAAEVLRELELDLDPDAPVHTLSLAQQQMVEIAKATSQKARVLVMDEPTAALSERETARLFALIRQLRAAGVAIIYISHRMAEVFELGDRVTVLRDGSRVSSVLRGEATPDMLVQMMVGRTVDMTYPRNFANQPGAVLLKVERLAAANGVADVSLEVRAGEIVGLAGLAGSGRTEVARAIFGADRVLSGTIQLNGRLLFGGPEQARSAGVALIPESRKTQGVALARSVSDNLNVASLGKTFPSGIYRPNLAREIAQQLIGRLRIATPSPEQIVKLLSGGNQQKVVIGKWLQADAKLFIFDEPTRGVDVGAKSEIFALLDQLVAAGKGVLMISSELPEIVHVCDRAYVMRERRVAGHLTRAELNEQSVMRLAIGAGAMEAVQ
ncbi:sugar ABC transporter ATP-binding protein [Variovorax sp. KBS0712]|uniref:sugar ABC transporter ATP-binding protein n=1 Tax=Variovorax sp. KBS0712 TaxID=2578111 RepID=UPI0021B10413|nr:sugar ABC transporter ATP-binding protein [Variovorax sp. KBS0712]